MINNTYEIYSHNLANEQQQQVLLIKNPCHSKNMWTALSVSEIFAECFVLGG